MAQTLSDIKALLAAHGLRPRHRLGQNFLHDANQMQRIAAAAQIQPGELVLEVGPGTGALSEWLLDAGAKLVAVEIDRQLAPILHHRLDGHGPERFHLLVADVLAGKHVINPAVLAALGDMAGNAPQPPAFKMVANLPYHVASPLLANLALDHPSMNLAVVLVQREVAERLTATCAQGKAYGPLGIFMQALFEIQRLAVLPPGCFWPSPRIDSSLVRLCRRATPLTTQPHDLAALLQRLFSKRRKQIGAILGRDQPLPPGIDPSARPEQLDLGALILLTQNLYPRD